jgi:hypothetical protein
MGCRMAEEKITGSRAGGRRERDGGDGRGMAAMCGSSWSGIQIICVCSLAIFPYHRSYKEFTLFLNKTESERERERQKHTC